MNTLFRMLSSKVFMMVMYVFATLLISHFVLGTPAYAADECMQGTDGNWYINGDSNQGACIAVKEGNEGIGFTIPSLSDVLTFAIRAFFIIAGLAALIFLLLGALAWVTSGGDKENVSKAQSKITNAIIGVILVAVVLAVIVTLEQVVFGGNICLGLSCPITIPTLIKP